MGNIESLLFMEIMNTYDIEDKCNLNKINKKIYNNINNNIYKCHICNKKLNNLTIYRRNDLSFCSEQHRNINRYKNYNLNNSNDIIC
tara:strand:- start:557 stop:817 length:261 start_codon:yes stop_codon:yes gene_type:complete